MTDLERVFEGFDQASRKMMASIEQMGRALANALNSVGHYDDGDHPPYGDVYEARPLIVLDPANPKDVERLTRALAESFELRNTPRANAVSVLAALTPQPKLTRPEEDR